MTVRPFGRFLFPGPTDVRPEILQAMAQPMQSHRGEAFLALHARVVANLQQVFRTTRPVFAVSASATALMEMAIRGAPEGPILSLVNGAFSERFATVAQQCGRRVRRVSVPWGEVHPLGLIERHLVEEPFAALTVVHSETSTGTLCDLRAVTELAHRYGVMCLADAVTSVGASPVETDTWGLDFVLTGSQKALALPPGLAFAVASEPYILQAAVVPGRGRYLDPLEHEEAALRGGPPSTPAIPLFYAADAQLQDIAAEGIEARWARHAEMQAMVERWVSDRQAEGIAITFQAPAGARSLSVSCLALPPDRESREVVAALEDRGFTIGRGYSQLKDSTIRIGHMGDLRPEHLAPCLEALTDVLRAAPR
ncbi:aminotransferase class V-fold PLP-dependent enzyme [Pseudogemmatithrix spongiicola]|uniref:Aminotransferase class V-fold PLP-dependent enzyme n=1 Tax=Pseudogemmatithrix spongiicola TaxID=3062599 RepID=A0AA49JX71_9BACT|nr:aminotransferase class V-fold PLP-dependent enzyme [Gemmatimonadaceae bacterium 'strain 138']WKW16574.1 aminotransferase class V-fold PLP-dependent enzyme [Gemmatimonadaceae bacterium 'strain 318']